jgi:hypothetical protein
MPSTLRLLPPLRAKQTAAPPSDETPTVPAIPRARTVTVEAVAEASRLDDAIDAIDAFGATGAPDDDARGREIDRILVSYLLDLDHTV